MPAHRYLRAYMAGIVVPTVLVVFMLVACFIMRYGLDVPVPIERVVIFPLALVPTLFGLWNMLYTRMSGGWRLPLGLHGALLAVVLIPLGMTGAVLLKFLSISSSGIVWFDVFAVPYILFFPRIAILMIVYYLVWKYLVGFCNKALDLA